MDILSTSVGVPIGLITTSVFRVIGFTSSVNIIRPVSFITPAGASYIISGQVSNLSWAELR